jgi:hypothetical protein
MATVFDNDDQAYQHWLAANPDGYVINTPRGMPASYMVLHHARCSTIRDYNQMAQQGGFTERQYVKICSPTVDDLREWVRQNGRPDGTFSSECSLCNR